MDIEQKQADLIEHFVKRASALQGSALGAPVADATSHPSLFAFSEILAVPSVLQVRLSLCFVAQKARTTD
jgi:COP9 signalosome complex subunit 7